MGITKQGQRSGDRLGCKVAMSDLCNLGRCSRECSSITNSVKVVRAYIDGLVGERLKSLRANMNHAALILQRAVR
jgi:hypothetical protein